jgi:hypothetical protein
MTVSPAPRINSPHSSALGDNPDKSQWAKFRIHHDHWSEGVFTAPHGLSRDHDGNLYVEDWNEHGRITKLVPAKNFKQLGNELVISFCR